MLTHRNVLSNIDAVDQVFQLTPDDVVLGVLPFFHSFGFTVHALAAAGRRLRRRLPSEPDRREDDRRARRALRRARCSSARRPSAAPTSARCQPEQFAKLRLAIVGAEKLREPVAAAFKEQVRRRADRGLRLHRDGAGRGGECARRRRTAPRTCRRHPARVGRPSAARRRRDGRRSGHGRRTARSARRDCCSSTARTGWPGYLGEPELTQQAFRDGWYVTGDIATIDDDGLHHASPIGCRGSARSPARWCRT